MKVIIPLVIGLIFVSLIPAFALEQNGAIEMPFTENAHILKDKFTSLEEWSSASETMLRSGNNVAYVYSMGWQDESTHSTYADKLPKTASVKTQSSVPQKLHNVVFSNAGSQTKSFPDPTSPISGIFAAVTSYVNGAVLYFDSEGKKYSKSISPNSNTLISFSKPIKISNVKISIKDRGYPDDQAIVGYVFSSSEIKKMKEVSEKKNQAEKEAKRLGELAKQQTEEKNQKTTVEGRIIDKQVLDVLPTINGWKAESTLKIDPTSMPYPPKGFVDGVQANYFSTKENRILVVIIKFDSVQNAVNYFQKMSVSFPAYQVEAHGCKYMLNVPADPIYAKEMICYTHNFLWMLAQRTINDGDDYLEMAKNIDSKIN